MNQALPVPQACGVVHFENGWQVYFAGRMDDTVYPSRTEAILELAKRDRAATPYPEHCLHPDKCAGKSSCQRDPNCID